MVRRAETFKLGKSHNRIDVRNVVHGDIVLHCFHAHCVLLPRTQLLAIHLCVVALEQLPLMFVVAQWLRVEHARSDKLCRHVWRNVFGAAFRVARTHFQNFTLCCGATRLLQVLAHVVRNVGVGHEKLCAGTHAQTIVVVENHRVWTIGHPSSTRCAQSASQHRSAPAAAL